MFRRDGPPCSPGQIQKRMKRLIDSSRWQVLRLRMAEGARQMEIDRAKRLTIQTQDCNATEKG